MKPRHGLHLFLALAIGFGFAGITKAQESHSNEPVIQMCVGSFGDAVLLKASVSAHSFNLSIVRPGKEVVQLNEQLPEAALVLKPGSAIYACQLAISAEAPRAALAVPTAGGVVLALLDLSEAKLTKIIRLKNMFPIQFPLHQVGFIHDSEQLAVSQVHYKPTGEPEIGTQIVAADGSITSVLPNITGPQYAEVAASSFDYVNGLVWFLCPVYSARIDRQPRCTLASAPILGGFSSHLEVPPPPDDRVIGSGQPELGFVGSGDALLLAEKRLWAFHFKDRSFREMILPETPHYIRWSEFPGQPKFSSDGRIAAVPVLMFHAPFFEEGQVRHGTKLVIVDLQKLRILQTIQPPNQENLVDFALIGEGTSRKVVLSWGKEWKTFDVRF